MSSSDVVGFFPTINGHTHVGHGFCWAATAFTARHMGAKLHLDAHLTLECQDDFAARQISLLCQLAMPDRMTTRRTCEADYRLADDLLPEIEAALENGAYLSRIEDPWVDADGNEQLLRAADGRMTHLAHMYLREEGADTWFNGVSARRGTTRFDLMGGLLAEYRIQDRVGVTVSMDGMDIRWHMLPHWQFYSRLFGDGELYWDARFIAALVDPATGRKISTSGEQAEIRLPCWELGKWLDRYGPLNLMRLFWAWMQDEHPPIPKSMDELIARFDPARVPCSTETALQIVVDRVRMSPEWIDF